MTTGMAAGRCKTGACATGIKRSSLLQAVGRKEHGGMWDSVAKHTELGGKRKNIHLLQVTQKARPACHVPTGMEAVSRVMG